ncbi:MAG TPA: hypothetical protein VEV84_11865 [Pyrinomonadaceae bacterium]|nr:hypothetical protein [Pyrinomonadaceae bacterium]
MGKGSVKLVDDFPEFAGDKRLHWIAEEWLRYADRLAEWTMEHLVNRRDVWSQYVVKNGEVGVVMLPVKERRKSGAEMVTMNKLRRHYSGRAISHLIGLHSISDHSTCKWFAVDIDLHDENISNADEIAVNNLAAAMEWAGKLRELGMDPLVFDSNGVGGYHIWTLLDSEYPLEDTYNFADELRSNWEELGLPRKPEIFPPKPHVEGDDLPYGLRLPGRHPRRAFYIRVYNFDALEGENEWLEGGEAVEIMLATKTVPLPRVKKQAVKAEVKTGSSNGRQKTVTKKRKPRVCLDLDGVLAQYNGWEGLDKIGPPIPGALDFAWSLAEIADIVIFTSRCSLDAGGEALSTRLSPRQLRIKVIEWLEKYKFPYADVYTGQGKPRASVFIDDRAVYCSPQRDKNAFKTALEQTRSVLSKSKKDVQTEALA